MKRTSMLMAGIAVMLAAFALTGADEGSSIDGPQFTAEGKLMRPQNYREWIFLSSGLGMNYGPVAAEARDENPMFDNVFVTRTAYKSFLETGRWPDKTMFILEVRASESKGSINKGGHYQSGVAGVEADFGDQPGAPGGHVARSGELGGRLRRRGRRGPAGCAEEGRGVMAPVDS